MFASKQFYTKDLQEKLKTKDYSYYQGWSLKLIIFKVIYDINDYLVIYNERTKQITENKIRYNNKCEPYFIKNGHRIYLNECIREYSW